MYRLINDQRIQNRKRNRNRIRGNELPLIPPKRISRYKSIKKNIKKKYKSLKKHMPKMHKRIDLMYDSNKRKYLIKKMKKRHKKVKKTHISLATHLGYKTQPGF